jgi:P-type conjugative transfer protein TrbJ
MNKSHALRSALLLTACAFATALLPKRVSAQWTVIDPSNLAQNVKQVLRSAQQINNQRQQITYQLKALRKLESPNWREIATLVQQLDMLMQRAEALGYSIESVDQEFARTFPGYRAETDNLRIPVEQRLQARRTIGTMRAALNVLNRQSRQFRTGQERLAEIKASMADIEGTQEALELQSTIDAFLAEEVGLLRQAVTTQTNVQAVYNAYVVNREAYTRANYRAMMDRMSVAPAASSRNFSLQVNR